MSELGVYLYAVASAAAPPSLDEVAGIDGKEVYAVTQGPLSAAVGPVRLDEFDEEPLRKNLEDLTWLTRVARAHDDVIRQLARTANIAPARLATIFLDDEAVRRRLDADHEELTAALARIQDRREWSIKVYSSSDEMPREESPAQTGEETGTAYLRRRSRERLHDENRARSDAAAAEELHTAVRGQVCASRRLRPQDRRLSGHVGEMLLNSAYLVDQAREDEFRGAVARIAAEHPEVRVELNGPWPPYSFATLEGS